MKSAAQTSGHRCSGAGGDRSCSNPSATPGNEQPAATSRKRKPRRAKQLGVTDTEYAAMLEAQDGGCAICGNPPKTRRLSVDHDHATGSVRGLLCHRCNRALPTWVTAEWLNDAADYIG